MSWESKPIDDIYDYYDRMTKVDLCASPAKMEPIKKNRFLVKISDREEEMVPYWCVRSFYRDNNEIILSINDYMIEDKVISMELLKHFGNEMGIELLLLDATGATIGKIMHKGNLCLVKYPDFSYDKDEGVTIECRFNNVEIV